ncbi:hypothetical protein BGW36DRAFT_368515 [Talaromyces proteolyticus]|uniref:Zn(2)-C6 fungal-type domain-containing protein n=1 Tax=Talaromyces proteolyticus TaxID=1131652 RepID=A0AAD4L3N0_9EURO|nr:uncharacterized protein BGW36DRAFT_368515 [Talaromyces proteolyticus]KAH8705981.1 hypothetical protein BGW36DRAFT_368515 [Talaromyces proteolyticus]
MNQGSSQVPRFRPIAPRSKSESSAEFNPAARTSEQSHKVRRAPIACMPCRKHRTKCSTEQPCAECIAHNRECVYDHAADKRRKEHIERKEQVFQTQLDECQDFIKKLLTCIRHVNDDRLNYLIEVIRSTDDREVIETVVDSLSMGSPDLGKGEGAEGYRFGDDMGFY